MGTTDPADDATDIETRLAVDELAAWAEYRGYKDRPEARARWKAAHAALVTNAKAVERWREAVYAARASHPTSRPPR